MTAAQPEVVVTHWVHPEVMADLARFSRPSCPPADVGVWPRAEVLARAAGAEALVVCMADRVDADLLDACPRLRIVAATLKGADNIDVAACRRRAVEVTVVDDVIIGPTAELAVGLALGVLRRIGEADRGMRSAPYRGWRPVLYGTGLAGADVGIVGLGALGTAVARLLAVFGPARVLGHDPAAPDTGGLVRLAGLGEVLGASDLVVVAAPLVDSTRHLVDARRLATMRAGACLVNVGRGSVVDEEAVADALERGQLGGYAADVWAMEDQSVPDRPARVPARLLAHPRTLVTPHLGSAVDRVRLAMSRQSAEQVRRVLTAHGTET